jgi:HK97 family phage portal protein
VPTDYAAFGNYTVSTDPYLDAQAIEPVVRAGRPGPPRQGVNPPGGFSGGSTLLGGPAFTDSFRSHRGPLPYELLELYRSVVYSCVALNEHSVIRVPLRLYADGSKSGGKPRSACDPVPIGRSMRHRLAHDPWLEHCRVAPTVVDQVYEVRTHEILHLLDNPDGAGYFDRAKLLSLIVRYCDTVGIAYFVPQRSGRGLVPNILWPLYSQYVQPIRLAGSPLIDFFQYFGDRLPFADVLRFRLNDSLRDPYASGYSPLYAAIEYARLESSFVSIQEQLLGSGPRPSIVFSPKDPMMPPGDPERMRFQQDLDRTRAGANAGKSLVTNGAWDITPISYAPTDLAGKDLSEYNIRMICSCFGIPPTIFTTETNLANIEAANQLHARNAVEPRCHMIASVLTRFARRFDPRLFFAFDSAIPEDEEKKARIWDIKLKNYSATINEATEEDKSPPKDYGKEPWMSGDPKQPTMIQEAHQMGMTSQAHAVANADKASEFQYSDEPGGGEDGASEEDGGAPAPGGVGGTGGSGGADETDDEQARSANQRPVSLSELKRYADWVAGRMATGDLKGYDFATDEGHDRLTREYEASSDVARSAVVDLAITRELEALETELGIAGGDLAMAANPVDETDVDEGDIDGDIDDVDTDNTDDDIDDIDGDADDLDDLDDDDEDGDDDTDGEGDLDTGFIDSDGNDADDDH